MNTFASILDKPASEIERPKPLPVGTYTAMVQGLPRIDKSTKKQTEFVEFTMALTGAGEDVDADELEAMGGIKGKTIKNTYYMTENSAYRLKDFLIVLGIETEGKTPREMLDETPGKECLITVKHEAAQQGDGVFARITDTAAIE